MGQVKSNDHFPFYSLKQQQLGVVEKLGHQYEMDRFPGESLKRKKVIV